MHFLKKWAIFLFSIYGFAMFVVLMLLLLPFFVIAFFLPSPSNGNMVFMLCRIWARIFFFITCIRYVALRKATLLKDQPYIFVSNHISYIDIPMMVLSTSGKNIRILGKAEMGKIPVFGFIYKMGTVSVNRKNPEERQKSVERLKFFLQKNVSIFICPEGTFNMTGKPLKEFYDGAFKIAVETSTPVVPIIFADTYSRLNFKSIFSLTPGKCRAIILPPVSAEGMDVQELKEEVFDIMKTAIEKENAPWIT